MHFSSSRPSQSPFLLYDKLCFHVTIRLIKGCPQCGLFRFCFPSHNVVATCRVSRSDCPFVTAFAHPLARARDLSMPVSCDRRSVARRGTRSLLCSRPLNFPMQSTCARAAEERFHFSFVVIGDKFRMVMTPEGRELPTDLM